MADDALVWWSALNEDIQGSWRLLRQAMLSKFNSRFCGGSGVAAENFLRAVYDKAIHEGKREDNKWIVAYAESCLAGEALRWYAQLDSDTQENWKKLQKALLAQYPRDGTASPSLNLIPTPPAAASFAPTPKVTHRGRIRVLSGRSSIVQYLSKVPDSDNRLHTTESSADALELEWSTGSDGLSILSIPGSQIPGYDLLGLKWELDSSYGASENYKSVPSAFVEAIP
ncbi:hypothetical protein FS837_009372 [Tulasnella sp. UAMH 9824]|nr:hypothetical protein FS837_009372 [Tulasnella sp. UAMH 9824]